MSKNRVKLNICGYECVIGSDDSESYVRSIGDEVGKAMEDIINGNERISMTMSSVITALRFCDEAHKSAGGADNLRSQIKDYLEDSSHARAEADEAKREIQRLNNEIEKLRSQLSKSGKSEPPLPDKPVNQEAVNKIISSGSSVEKPQAGSFSRVMPQNNADDPDGFMSFFERKND